MKFKIFLFFLICCFTFSKCLSTMNFKQSPLSNNQTKYSNIATNITVESNKTKAIQNNTNITKFINSLNYIHINNSNQTLSKIETQKNLHIHKSNSTNYSNISDIPLSRNLSIKNKHLSSNEKKLINENFKQDNNQSSHKTQVYNSTNEKKISVEKIIPNEEQLVKSQIFKSNLNSNSKNTKNPESPKVLISQHNGQILNSQESQIETIVEVPVSYSTGISYYYPYFYKTHLITFPEETNNFFSQSDLVDSTKTCSDNCLLCSIFNSAQCLRCSNGLYLNEGKCLEYCPEGKLADILRAKCVRRELSVNLDIVYSMAYSVGSCNNMCGKMVQDCSCAPSCKSKGNCCTNYDEVNCDFIIEKSNKTDEQKCKKAGCALCEEKENSLKCSQCHDDKLLYNGTCVNTCPEGFSTNKINKVCNKEESSCNSIPNCEYCSIDTYSSTNKNCNKCRRGTFLYNSNCVDKCPEGFRADRVTWTCLEPPVFGWYWVYPSRNSCKNKCNIVKNDNKDSNCSCFDDCVQEGSCCPDYDTYCGGNDFYLRKNGNQDSDKTSKKTLTKIH